MSGIWKAYELDENPPPLKPDEPHDHEWKYRGDEYGGLAGGGDYEVLQCTKCGKVRYVELPD